MDQSSPHEQTLLSVSPTNEKKSAQERRNREILRASPARWRPTVNSGDKLRWIGRKLGVGSAELPASTPARHPEIGIFDFFLYK
jgi:hypothetical protein